MEPRPGPESGEPYRLTPSTASAMLVLYTLIYVLPLYASRSTRPSPVLSRDSPLVIRARIRSVSFSTAVASFITFALLRTSCGATPAAALHSMGYWPVGVRATLSSLTLTAILFTGPLYETLVLDGAWVQMVRLRPFANVWSEWTAWRNLVVGPLTEELLFRSAAVPLLLQSQVALGNIIFLSPVIFGLAHIHHFYEFRISHPRVPVLAAVARSLFQLTYTSLFGAYATFLYLRTGSLLAVVLAHAFCNAMGLPRVWGMVRPHWLGEKPMAPSWAPLFATVVYYVLLVTGLIAWWMNMFALTETSTGLAHLTF